MELIYKDIRGYEFVKVGKFIKKNGKSYTTDQGPNSVTLTVLIEFINDLFKKIDESVYAVLINDKNLVYIGEYSYNLKHRWIKGDDFAWHQTVNKISDEIDKKNCVSLWVICDPFIEIEGKKINISKSIEHEILKEEIPSWNNKGKMAQHIEWRQNNCISMNRIIEEIDKYNDNCLEQRSHR